VGVGVGEGVGEGDAVAVGVPVGIWEGKGNGRGIRLKSTPRLSSTAPITTHRHKGVMDFRELIGDRSPK